MTTRGRTWVDGDEWGARTTNHSAVALVSPIRSEGLFFACTTGCRVPQYCPSPLREERGTLPAVQQKSLSPLEDTSECVVFAHIADGSIVEMELFRIAYLLTVTLIFT